jgi:hypothetical protein
MAKKKITKKKASELLYRIMAGLPPGKLVGFIKGIPVIERDDVPKGVLYMVRHSVFKNIK